MKPARAPGSIWALRREVADGYVETAPNDRIRIVVPDPNPFGSGRLITVLVSRRDARLVAKRINECLDATTKGGST